MSCATINYADFCVKMVRSGLGSGSGKMLPIRPDPQHFLLMLICNQSKRCEMISRHLFLVWSGVRSAGGKAVRDVFRWWRGQRPPAWPRGQADLVGPGRGGRQVSTSFLSLLYLTVLNCTRYCGSGMVIPDPNFSIPNPGSKRFRIPDPGAKRFRIPDPGAKKFRIPDTQQRT